MSKKPPSGPGGLVVVDKPAGLTSHDVVGRLRRILGTRRVGHAGTLDPMATGVLVVGVERSTKLLNHLILETKSYSATIRLGASTVTDDAEGEVVTTADASAVTAADILRAIEPLTGDILQRPSTVSALKVDGRRAYDLVRAGEEVDLPPRPVTVSRFAVVGGPRADGRFLDVDVEVDCSSGTYIRALARDLGAALQVGGHLTALRRTRVGPFDVTDARTLEELTDSDHPLTLTLTEAIGRCMPVRSLTDHEASELSFGRFIDADGTPGTYGGVRADGTAVALLHEVDGRARPVLGFTPAGTE